MRGRADVWARAVPASNPGTTPIMAAPRESAAAANTGKRIIGCPSVPVDAAWRQHEADVFYPGRRSAIGAPKGGGDSLAAGAEITCALVSMARAAERGALDAALAAPGDRRSPARLATFPRY